MPIWLVKIIGKRIIKAIKHRVDLKKIDDYVNKPNELDKNGFVQPVLNLECPNSRQQYDIFEISLKFKSFGTELLGTLLELEPDNKITKNEIKELMKEIIINEEEQNA